MAAQRLAARAPPSSTTGRALRERHRRRGRERPAWAAGGDHDRARQRAVPAGRGARVRCGRGPSSDPHYLDPHEPPSDRPWRRRPARRVSQLGRGADPRHRPRPARRRSGCRALTSATCSTTSIPRASASGGPRERAETTIITNDRTWNWTIAGAPSAGWARDVYRDLSEPTRSRSSGRTSPTSHASAADPSAAWRTARPSCARAAGMDELAVGLSALPRGAGRPRRPAHVPLGRLQGRGGRDRAPGEHPDRGGVHDAGSGAPSASCAATRPLDLLGVLVEGASRCASRAAGRSGSRPRAARTSSRGRRVRRRGRLDAGRGRARRPLASRPRPGLPRHALRRERGEPRARQRGEPRSARRTASG